VRVGVFSGALLEAMDGIPVTGIFATHLHEMFDLPLRTSHVAYKRMGYTTTQGGPSVWTYRLEDGRCAAHSHQPTSQTTGATDSA
jgi:DNA mismatch repair ATPase MutS